MKFVKRILLLLLILVLVACGGPYFFAKYSEPKSEGDIILEGLHENVEVISDPYGIPHIYAKNEEDLFFAMGYIHAQERLFQMELLRRLAMGRLSEILGPDLVETDILFRTLGLDEAAKEAKKIYLSEGNAPYQKAALAYLAGLNKFVDIGATPTEFALMGIPKTHFTEENFYHILGYMAFGFAMAQREEPILEKIRTQLGPEYLADWVVNHREGMQTIPVTNGNGSQQVFPEVNPATALHQALAPLPIPLFLGSNSWVIGPSKSASGKPILANDAHIGYSQPATWFEAHLECPGFSVYGHFLAGFPFGVIGHNRELAWGITMLQNDDMDFYYEKINPENPNQVWFENKWEEVRVREETLPIKDQKDTVIQVRHTRHGPLISGVFDGIKGKDAVSMSWTYLKNPCRNLEATYLLNHAKSMEETRHAASMIEAPGLNLMFADTKGNIAWWAAGRWTEYGEGVNSQLFLDGSSGANEATGLMDFEKNPRAENPDWGFVYSANNQPAKLDSTYLPGQYSPEDRAKRIFELLKGKEKWTVEEVKAMSNDVKNDLMPGFIQEIIPEIKRESGDLSDREKLVLNILKSWDGNHSIEDVGPTIYMKLIYFILKDAIGDELGESDFESATHTFLLRRTLPVLLRNKTSPWWDDIHTPNVKEERQVIFSNAFFKTVASLTQQLGENPQEWTWGKVHTFEVQHPVGQVPGMDMLYNVGPFPAPGGLDVINNIGANFSADGLYRATYGPSKRIVIDMADVENGYCIMPTGNSGHLLNPHYADQTEMYLKGEFRKMMMNRDEIVKTQEGRLELKSKK